MAVLIILIVLAVPGATLEPTAVLWSVVAHKPYGSVSKMHSQKKSVLHRHDTFSSKR